MNKEAFIVVDLGYGDQGKGTTVDYLTRATNAHLNVRFNGGPQAAHHVVLEDGRWHKFSHFGSGMFVPSVSTFLSRFMLVSPKAMLKEASHLSTIGVEDVLSRTYIDSLAPIITPFHQAMNRIREMLRGKHAHGSCGMGIGETMYDVVVNPQLVLLAGDLAHRSTVEMKLRLIKEDRWARIRTMLRGIKVPPDVAQEIQRAFIDDGVIPYFLDIYENLASSTSVVDGLSFLSTAMSEDTVVFEAAQGVLLDEWFGFHPYTTWSTTTFENADTLLKEINYDGNVYKVGVTRAYSTRHGAGPFVTEDADMTRRLPEAHNATNKWQGRFRAGWLDMVALKYAREVAGHVDCLAVTCLDRVKDLGEIKFCHQYTMPNGDKLNEIPVRHDMTRDLEFREYYTKMVDSATPSFTLLKNIEELLAEISRHTGVPAGILSYGPTASDKIVSSSVDGCLAISRLRSIGV